MVSLEPVELLDHHRAGRKRVRVLVWQSARQENLGKARIRSRRLARILSGGNDEVVDHVSGALHAFNRDAAAMSIAEEKTAGFPSSVGLAASATPMPRRRIRAVVTAEVERMGELQTGTAPLR
jgi:hypothetical protein